MSLFLVNYPRRQSFFSPRYSNIDHTHTLKRKKCALLEKQIHWISLHLPSFPSSAEHSLLAGTHVYVTVFPLSAYASFPHYIAPSLAVTTWVPTVVRLQSTFGISIGKKNRRIHKMRLICHCVHFLFFSFSSLMDGQIDGPTFWCHFWIVLDCLLVYVKFRHHRNIGKDVLVFLI